MSSMEERRVVALNAAVRTVERPYFLGEMTRPRVVSFAADDVIKIAQQYERYLHGGS